jgi:oligopeptide/dipeptide ABC transporter ATP-binding protein
MTDLLRVESLVKHFRLDKDTYIGAVNDVSFTIGRGETLGLVGESGSGKTTVGRCVLRLLEPTSGSVLFDGEDITRVPEAQLRRLRARMQLVFQEPFASLNPRRTVRQTVEEPLILHKVEGEERRNRVRDLLKAVGLSERYLDRYPGQLTGSEQQRVGIARALVTHPDLVVLDEPTSTLDQSVRGEILEVLADLQRRFETSYLLISHDLTAIEQISHRIAIMYLGRMVEFGSAEQIFRQQHHPYSKALLSAVLYPDPHRRLEPFLLEGEIPSAVNPQDRCPLYGRCPIGVESCTRAFPAFEEVEPGHIAACYRTHEFVGAATGSDDSTRAPVSADGRTGES